LGYFHEVRRDWPDSCFKLGQGTVFRIRIRFGFGKEMFQMRQMGWAFVAAAALASVVAPTAEAGVTCKVVPSWCPADNKGDQKFVHVGAEWRPDASSPRTAVPEPASLLLLGVGVSAVGAAVARRRKRNNNGE
jgi:hypothetical protein